MVVFGLNKLSLQHYTFSWPLLKYTYTEQVYDPDSSKPIKEGIGEIQFEENSVGAPKLYFGHFQHQGEKLRHVIEGKLLTDIDEINSLIDRKTRMELIEKYSSRLKKPAFQGIGRI